MRVTRVFSAAESVLLKPPPRFWTSQSLASQRKLLASLGTLTTVSYVVQLAPRTVEDPSAASSTLQKTGSLELSLTVGRFSSVVIRLSASGLTCYVGVLGLHGDTISI